MGTVNLLEAARQSAVVKAVVNITTDKCYENREWLWSYREDESLGGYDPYSSSKACSEIVTAAYRQSFLAEKGIGVATARAGNVIGGGDWSEDRLIPDFFRAMAKQETLIIRSPNAVRPWQHVLEPLSGYLNLAEKLFNNPLKYSDAWNFGPSDESAKSVSWILNKLTEKIPNAKWAVDKNPQVHEAGLLKLDSSKAKALLDWHPRWSLEESLNKIVEWQDQFNSAVNLKEFSNSQIASYMGAIS
jgi:CDP-glucose 4,6-dehydratase